MNAIKETNFNFPGQTGFYKGKVRDVYYFKDTMAIVVTDRISAFDVVLPEAIPYKGQVLNQLAAHFMEATIDIVPNWILSVPDPSVTTGHLCEPFKVEMVVRGYLAGHAWREYKSGKRMICSVPMPEGLKENDKFPEPLITPTTKADHGHDEDISREEILKTGLVSEADYVQLEDYTLKLFARGSEMAAEKELILVDTKYEFGKKDGKIYLIDEVHTPDSSRYFYANGYADRQNKNEPQKQLSKEFVRQWLISNGFQGQEGQAIPDMDENFIQSVSERYIELYEKISGKAFIKSDISQVIARVEQNIREANLCF